MANNIPISQGTGASSVATETISGISYQQVEIYGQGGSSVLGINPDGSLRASIIGVPTVNINAGSIVAIASGNQSVSGTLGASIIGQLPAGTAPLGSVAVLQGTNPWVTVVPGSVISLSTGSVITVNVGSVITVNQNSSILAVPVGSVITTFSQVPSIVGTYAEDAASASGDKGFLVMGARNDTLSSVTSADGDYSSHVVGPAGELISANAPFTKWVQGTGSMLTGTPLNGGSVAIIAAQGSSIFTYITAIQVANPSANNVWVRFDGGTSSIVGFTMAPANGGSNFVIPNAWKTNANSAFTASVSGSASVYITATGFIAKI